MTAITWSPALQNTQQRRIEPPGRIVIRRRSKFILKSSESRSARSRALLCAPKLSCVPNGSGMRVNGLPKTPSQQLPVRHVVRHLAQPIHVVAKRDQTRRPPRQHAKGMTHPRRARHLAESADMRQPGRPIPGLEQRLILARPVPAGPATLAASSSGHAFRAAGPRLLRTVADVAGKLGSAHPAVQSHGGKEGPGRYPWTPPRASLGTLPLVLVGEGREGPMVRAGPARTPRPSRPSP